HGIAAVIEPINNRLGSDQGAASYTTRGMHGYFLNHTEHARRIIDELGYRGWIGCEYRPLGNTSDGLGWAARYGIAASPQVGA
ncbi:MAG: hypothetical protein ACREUQ_10965, partial [Burkholderiales bacterium]